MADDDQAMERQPMSAEDGLDSATRKVLATIDDPSIVERYPDRTHFISAPNPAQGEMATRALFAGDPVVLVYPDGHELLITPEQTRGLAGLFLFAATLLIRWRRRYRDTETIQFPPGTKIEARDSAGTPVAA